MIQLVRRRLLPCAALWLGLTAHGCSRGQSQTTIFRRLDGKRVAGTFVPPSSYEAYIRGEIALARGRAEEAIGQFQLASAGPQEDPYLLARLAKAYALSGDAARAEAALREAWHVDACSEAAWLAQGEIAHSAGDLNRAAESYRQALRCAPSSRLGLQGLAEVYRARGAYHQMLSAQLAFASSEGGRADSLRAFVGALDDAGPADISFALERWAVCDGVSRDLLIAAIERALQRNLKTVVLRLREHAAFGLPPALAARIAWRSSDGDALLSLLALYDGERLGGHAAAARLAWEAGDYARAELEASLQSAPSRDGTLDLLRARANARLGAFDEALAEAKELSPRGEALLPLSDALSHAGCPALASELRALRSAKSGGDRTPQ